MAGNGNRLPFDRFMELALYAPGLGYYSNGLRKFGEAGDFVTAPEISPLFGRCIAGQCLEVMAQTGECDILEFGAGSGRLAADMLAELERLGHLPRHYFILELSADLRQRQRALLATELPHLARRVQWLDRLPARFRGILIANEVLDAMPVQRFRIGAGGVQEQFVGWESERLQPFWDEPQTQDLAQSLAALAERYALPPGYASEINLRARAWIGELADCLERGLVLLIDYGYSGREFYHPQRDCGTLICHYRHRVHSDPFIHPGLQDITANVDFTAIAEAGEAAGLECITFTSQAWFLIGGGLEGLLTQLPGFEQDPQRHLSQLQAIKRLTLPSEMGERFKVLGLTRGLKEPPSGLAFHSQPL
ncbi:MAG: SAM-dependent methyltransferase [Gammaproteobacteria bacterium]|nr:SAM-dependent methyltransferase [Gammaproteobacteria bacterium]MBU1655857.1 SAM-dependent methyltransferase [Gammaproteobacteria bacterium]MBU1960092.1 SAM-dependent methyltransferase [Gammaproteobacteria bacterium]